MKVSKKESFFIVIAHIKISLNIKFAITIVQNKLRTAFFKKEAVFT
jgi:hypothetical protein